MVNGSTIHSNIKDKVQELESQQERLEADLYAKENKITNLGERREQIYLELAFHYLPRLEADAIESTLKEVRRDVDAIFASRQQKRAQLEETMRSNRGVNKKLEQQIEAVTEEIKAKLSQAEGIGKEVAGELKEDAPYKELDQQAKAAESRLEQNRNRVEEVEKQAAEKLPAFQGNKIFSYLLRIGYGTPEYDEAYEGKNIRRRLNAWAASAIDFTENKKRYDFLVSMPKLMKQEVERRQMDLDTVVWQMKAIESQHAEKYGLSKIIEAGKSLVEKRKQLLEQDERQDQEYKRYLDERKTLDSAKDPYYQKAIGKLKDYLKGQTLADLRERAASTLENEDNVLVKELEGIDQNVRSLKDQAKTAKSKRDALAEKVTDLKAVERRFRDHGYDGSYSRFRSGLDIDNLLIGYTLGRTTAGDINSQLDYNHHTETPSYHSSTSYTTTSSHNSDFGSFGGFHSGGGLGGGGFHSGHGI